MNQYLIHTFRKLLSLLEARELFRKFQDMKLMERSAMISIPCVLYSSKAAVK